MLYFTLLNMESCIIIMLMIRFPVILYHFGHLSIYCLIQVLHKESLTLINWFCLNCMQPNPGKFEAVGFG